jgi:hypothetical protein
MNILSNLTFIYAGDLNFMQGRRNDTELHQPGDYGKDANGNWHCCAPPDTGDWASNFHGNLARHTVVEHEDGTITVSPSILIRTHDKGDWHGFLERGVWREC